MMKRLLSTLLMVVMVLAPCAVAHAVSMKVNHSGPQMSGSMSGQMGAKPDQSHGQHIVCMAGQHDAGYTACSSNCDTFQRTSATNTLERSAPDVKIEYAALVLALNYLSVALDVEAPSVVADLVFEGVSDSKSVLRMTARLRL